MRKALGDCIVIAPVIVVMGTFWLLLFWVHHCVHDMDAVNQENPNKQNKTKHMSCFTVFK